MTVVVALALAAGAVLTAASGAVFSLASIIASTLAPVTVKDNQDAELKNQKAVHEHDLRALRKEHDGVVTRLRAELEAAQAQLMDRTKQTALVSYRGEQRFIAEAVKDTTERVSNRAAYAAGRNIAAMPMESVPFLGIGVIVGATTWELADACALMQDMHELEVALDPDTANDPAKAEACGMSVPTTAELWDELRSKPRELTTKIRSEYGEWVSPHMVKAYDWFDGLMHRSLNLLGPSAPDGATP
jgi:hypothetical protein